MLGNKRNILIYRIYLVHDATLFISILSLSYYSTPTWNFHFLLCVKYSKRNLVELKHPVRINKLILRFQYASQGVEKGANKTLMKLHTQLKPRSQHMNTGTHFPPSKIYQQNFSFLFPIAHRSYSEVLLKGRVPWQVGSLERCTKNKLITSMTVQRRWKKIFLMRNLFSPNVLSEGPVIQNWSSETKLQELLTEGFFFSLIFNSSNLISLPLHTRVCSHCLLKNHFLICWLQLT